MPFKQGKSGNPAGRPRGALNRATLLIQALLEGQAEQLGRKAIAMALEGDPAALRLCLERLVPPLRDRPVRLRIPAATTAREITAALATVTEAVAAGGLTPIEGNNVASLLEAHRKALETVDFEERLARVEQALKFGRGGPTSDDKSSSAPAGASRGSVNGHG
jgi:hypothetical protein